MDLTERYQGEESCEKRLLGKKSPSRLCLPGLQRGQLLRRCASMHTPMVVHEILNTDFSLTADTMMENTHLPSGRGLWPSGSWHTKRLSTSTYAQAPDRPQLQDSVLAAVP